MSNSNAEGATRGKEITRLVLRIGLAGLAIAVLTALSKAAVAHWELPGLLRPLLVLSTLGPIFMLTRKPIPLRPSDELEQRIGMETMAFAFGGLIVVFIAADLLRDTGVTPNFTWKTQHLLGVMALLFLLGYGWVKRRYR